MITRLAKRSDWDDESIGLLAHPPRRFATLWAMKSPWKTRTALDPGAQYLALASSIPPKSIKSTWKLFRGAFAVRRQLLDTDGVWRDGTG